MPATIQIHVSDELAARLEPLEQGKLHEVIEMGLRRLDLADQTVYDDLNDVLELLASLPAPEEILSLHPSETLQSRIDRILTKNRDDLLTPQEEKEWEQYEYIEHIVRMAKAQAQIRLQQRNS